MKQLGDPSGQQTSAYWNEWFSVVGAERQFFEWYCDAKEVARVLEYHLPLFDDDDDHPHQQEEEDHHATTPVHHHHGRHRQMIHPGAGNSMVPLEFMKTFPHHQQIVVDISPVALEMAQECLAQYQHRPKEESRDRTRDNTTAFLDIQFLVGDVLHPPLHSSLTADSFDAWMDKGLMDALFANHKEHIIAAANAAAEEEENQRHCAMVFQEAHRLLHSNSGIMFVVTLAEPHTLQLLLQNWCDQQHHHDDDPTNTDSSRRWSPTLHIWELVPLSGAMRPFGVVLTKETSTSELFDSTKKLVWHGLNGVFSTTVHPLNGMCEATMLTTISTILEESRQRFREEILLRSQQQNHHDASPFRLLATLEVKPYDDQVDLMGVGQQITSRSYAQIGPVQWLTWENDDDEPSSTTTTPVVAATTRSYYSKLVPMAFGLSKLVLRCLVASSDELKEMVDDIMDWHQANGGDCIQSIDIDWEATHPVGTVTVRP